MEKLELPKSRLGIPYWALVHCKNEDEAKKVLLLGDYFGYHWYNGTRYIYRFEYVEGICYDIVGGRYTTIDKEEEFGLEIVEAEDLIKMHKHIIRPYVATMKKKPFTVNLFR